MFWLGSLVWPRAECIRSIFLELKYRNIFGNFEGLADEDALSHYEAAIDNAIRFEESEVRKTLFRAHKARVDLNFHLAERLNTSYLEQMPLDGDAHFAQMSLLRELGRYEQLAEAIEHYYELNSFDSAAVNCTLTALLDANRPDLLRQHVDLALDQFVDGHGHRQRR